MNLLPLVALIGLIALGGSGSSAPGTLPGDPRPRPASFRAAADDATRTLEQRWYRAPGRWNMCLPDTCGSAIRDWGADALTYTLLLRARITHDRAVAPMAAALGNTLPDYRACRRRACAEWSDIPMWDAVAAARIFRLTGQPAVLRKARHAFTMVDRSDAFALGACPAIDFQRPRGGPTRLKTLETDANYIAAALRLYAIARDPGDLARARRKYAAVRRYFLDPALPLYTTYVFDDGRGCRQLPHRFFASVNGTMIQNGLGLATFTGAAAYRDDARATAHAVAYDLTDAAGIYADLQAENDIAEPLVEAMYDLATAEREQFARSWLLRNAAVAAPAVSGAYGRFFDGPAPRGTVSAWSANGGMALAIAAAGLDPEHTVAPGSLWDRMRFVAAPLDRAPATIAFTGRAVALIGTIGERCCEAGHVRVFIDGRETVDNTGIWQNKSSSNRRLPNSVLLSWRWPDAGHHTIALEPGAFNPKEGGSALRLSGYAFVP